MGERIMATLTFGGDLPLARVDDLIAVIRSEWGGLDWDEPAPTADDLLARLARSPGPVTIRVREANYGNLDALTDFCREHGLTYRHWFESGSEWDSAIRSWAPGMDAPAEIFASNQSERPMLLVDDVLEALAVRLTLAEVIADIEARVPETPPLRLLDETGAAVVSGPMPAPLRARDDRDA